MKKIISVFCLVLSIGFQIKAQTTITLQPDETTSKDALIWNIMPSTNFAVAGDFIATAWTNNSNLSIIRSLIDFNFSSIPANATILNATLSLYHYNSADNVGHSTQSGSNMCLLKRITSAWTENTVTWNNQPSTTVQNQVIIPASTNNSQDYPNINVTHLIQDIINNASSSYGMMMVLDDENYFRSMLFSTSNNTDINKRPKLVITYTTAPQSTDSCVTITPNFENWKNALIWNLNPSSTNSVAPDFIATAWSNSGNLSIIRALMKFDFLLPNNAVISSAKLSLYHFNSTSNVGHSTQSGSNAAVLSKITSAWNETTVCWNNQPATTTINQVILPASVSDSQDYANIDITNMVIDFNNNPTTNYGLMFKLLDESYYRSMLFASKNCTDVSKQPKLTICYHISTAVTDIQKKEIDLSATPNPFTDIINLTYELTDNKSIIIEIYDLLGKRIYTENLGLQSKGRYTHKLDNQFEKGIYVLKFSCGNQSKNIKIIKN
jgi:hypothetical protein